LTSSIQFICGFSTEHTKIALKVKGHRSNVTNLIGLIVFTVAHISHQVTLIFD